MAFAAACFFSACVSASVICERLAHGQSSLGWICCLAVTIGAVALIYCSRPALGAAGVAPILGAHLSGIVLATAAVHLAARAWLGPERFVERPAQFVNDGVLNLALLGLVWSYLARSPLVRAVLPVPAFLLVCGYALTKTEWHLDPFSGFGVQSYVVGQVFATAVGLFACYLLQPEAEPRS
jgi:hypothetical protein